MTPIFHYLKDGRTDGLAQSGPSRRLAHRGRAGWHATSVHTHLVLPRHTLASPTGTLSLWLMPIEALGPVSPLRHIADKEADYFIHPILSDVLPLRDRPNARFHLRYTTDWWRNLTAQFFPWSGKVAGQKAIIAPDHIHLKALRWHQLTVTWDRPAGQYRMFVNGVLVATQTQFLPVHDQLPGQSLYAGCPAFALADFSFFDHAFTHAQAQSHYRDTALEPDDAFDAALRRMHAGQDMPRDHWSLDPTWSTRLELTLTDPADLEQLHVQGMQDAHRITAEGLHVKTAAEPHGFLGAWTENRVENYFWTRQTFEGDVALELDFKLHKRNGLALVMIQASGMQREDFMADHPLRKGGEMSMVCWENVRNYHWEFYREIDNTRNDVASHLLVKNPWMAGLGYRCMPGSFELERWYTLRLTQEGARLRAMIDDLSIFDVTDTDTTLAGPVFTFGRVAFRCKYKTEMTFRNLRVHTRRPAFEILA